MRLTEKNSGVINCGGSIQSLGKEEYRKRYHEQSVKAHIKLGQLEDIEDELGIDLITFFKAFFQEEVYVKTKYGIDKAIFNPFNTEWDKEFRFSYVIREDDNIEYYLKDYGKTWALTKEELMK